MKRTSSKTMCMNIGYALHQAGAHTLEILKGPITQTDQAWQLPGLRCQDQIDGYSIFEYLDRTTSFNLSTFPGWYASCLGIIKAGVKLARNGVYPGTSKVFTNTSPEILRWWFSQPSDDGLAPTIFALEAVECWRRSSKVAEIIQTENDYYVKDFNIGIRDGLVLGWDGPQVSIAGSVDAYLEMPRGAVLSECHYDIVAKVRSAVVEHPTEDLIGIESALNALYFIYRDSHCADLVTGLQDSEGTALTAQAVKFAAKTAWDIWQSALPHTSKIQAIGEVLVPSLLQPKGFLRIFGDVAKIPVPTPRRLEAIERYFAKLVTLKRLDV